MDKSDFGKIRGMLFPIYANEIKKLLPLTFIFLFISFNYALLRSLKDVYVYNMIKKEAIYPLKVTVIPFIVVLTILYTFISKRVNRDIRFNIVVSYFLLFFFIFTFFLLPNCKSLQLDKLADFLNSYIKYPALWNCLRIWPVSLLYMHAEAWGTIVLGVSFWTFSNEIVSSIQAKRVYPFLTIGAALGSIASGTFLFYFSEKAKLQLDVVLFLILGILVIYNFLAFNISKYPEEYGIEQKVKKNKIKLSFYQSIYFLLKSKYLLLLTCIIFGYNIFIVFLESVWKGSVGNYGEFLKQEFLVDHPDMSTVAASEYAKKETTKIYGMQGMLVGFFSLFWIFFVASIVSKKKWNSVALFTPLMALIASSIFFVFYCMQNSFNSIASYFNVTSLYLLLIIGLFLICFVKSSKYVFFDTSKERAYIPLDEDSKVNGKAAIDAIGSRLAKGSSSVLITFLIYIFGSLDNIAYISFLFVFVSIAIWIVAVGKLNPLYEQKLAEQKLAEQKLAEQKLAEQKDKSLS